MHSQFVPLLDSLRHLASDLPAATVEDLARAIETVPAGRWDTMRSLAYAVVAHPHYRSLVSRLIDRWQHEFSHVEPASLALSLLTAARYQEAALREQSVELVWTGPDPEATPLRRTEQALLQVIDHALRELTVLTFAVYRIPLVAAALVRAAERDVNLRLVAETPEASSGKIAYDNIAALGPAVAEHARVYLWPRDQRPTTPDGHFGSFHPKAALADESELFISSANLTEYALTLNMEMGVLIRGGPLPGRVKQHIDQLIQTGILVALDRVREVTDE